MKTFIILIGMLSIVHAQCLLVIGKLDRRIDVYLKTDTYKKVDSFNVCYMSGTIGSKRQKGDMQVPEGIYKIVRFNPNSNYLLSMQINYPNKSDRILGAGVRDLGGDIFIHGRCCSAGCIAIGDSSIRKLYTFCKKMKSVDVIILPTFNTDKFERLRSHITLYGEEEGMPISDCDKNLWKGLKEITDYFNRTGFLPEYNITQNGSYELIKLTTAR